MQFEKKFLVGFDTTIISRWAFTATRSNKSIFLWSCFQYDRTRTGFIFGRTFLRDFTWASSCCIPWAGSFIWPFWCVFLLVTAEFLRGHSCLFIFFLDFNTLELELLSLKHRFIKLGFAKQDRLLLLKCKDQEFKQQFPLTY